jgi:carbonic anhydrase
MTVASEFEVANQQYAAGFDKADLPMPPGRCVSSTTQSFTSKPNL